MSKPKPKATVLQAFLLLMLFMGVLIITGVVGFHVAVNADVMQMMEYIQHL